MSNFKLATLFTVLFTWGFILLFNLQSVQQSQSIQSLPNEKEFTNKSTISIDNQIPIIYYEYTDEIQAIKDHTLAANLKELEAIRVKEAKRIVAEKLAEEKRVAEAKRVAEEKRQVELARVAEEKRVAELVVKREAKKKEKLKQQKKNQVVSRGDDNNAKTYVYEVTAYTAGVESTGKRKGDKDYGVTASGSIVAQGKSLACPKSIPFGTKVEIEGYGVYICEDRGAHIVNGRLDIYMNDLGKAQQFGRQKLHVKIYSK